MMMRKDNDKTAGQDLHRPIDQQEIQQPNDGDPVARERGNLVGQTAEAQPGVFETGAPSAIEHAVHGGISSSPDLIDPKSGEFVNVTDDAEMRTTREYFPPPERVPAEEAVAKRSDDDVSIVATPNKALDTEGAVLKHSKQKTKEPKEPMDR
jgi:hypothetical protein